MSIVVDIIAVWWQVICAGSVKAMASCWCNKHAKCDDDSKLWVQQVWGRWQAMGVASVQIMECDKKWRQWQKVGEQTLGMVECGVDGKAWENEPWQ